MNPTIVNPTESEAPRFAHRKRRNILLVNANRFKQPWPVMPFGLSCVASAVAQAGYTVKVLDLCFSRNPGKELIGVIRDFQPHAMGISIRNIDNCAGYNTQFLLDDVRRDVIEPCRELFSGPIVIGGPSVGINGPEMLDFLDLTYAIQGEGEQAMVAFLDRLFQNQPLDQVPGLIIRKNNRIVCENSADQIPNLNDLPFSRIYRYIDVKQYQTYGSPLQVQTKRGCAMKCGYCTYNRIEGCTWRLKDAERVADEIEDLVVQTGIRQVEFTDSTFNLPLNHAKAVLRAIIDRDLNLNLRTMGLNPGAVDKELAGLMQQAGFSEVDLGVESGCDTTLKGLAKSFTRKDILQAGAILHEHSIPVTWYLLLGGPGESEATLQETFETMDQAAAPWDLINVGVGLRVYKGAPLADSMFATNSDCTADQFLHPVHFEPDAISLDAVKYLTKSWALNRANVFMYDEDEKTPLAVMRLASGLKRITRSRRPLWQAFIAIRKMQRASGMNFLFKRLHEQREPAAISRLTRRLSVIQQVLDAPANVIRFHRPSEECEISLAYLPKDLTAAYALIHSLYCANGYADQNPNAMRVMLWNSLPGTYTLVAKKQGEIIGTVSYIMDSDAGLPMDEVSGQTLERFRRSGRRLCEVSGLAVDVTESDSTLLMNMFQYGLKMMKAFCGATDYVITVNPRHRLFYRKMLCFEQIGGSAAYKKVKNAPGIPMRLNLDTLEEVYRNRYGHLNGKKNLHCFFFVDKQAEMAGSIGESLAERDKKMSMGTLHDLFLQKTSVLSTPENYAIFCRQWIGKWIQQGQAEKQTS